MPLLLAAAQTDCVGSHLAWQALRHEAEKARAADEATKARNEEELRMNRELHEVFRCTSISLDLLAMLAMLWRWHTVPRRRSRALVTALCHAASADSRLRLLPRPRSWVLT